MLDALVDEVREMFDVNFFGALHMLQAAGRAMRGRGGAIVNVSSRLAAIGVPTMALYSASKQLTSNMSRTTSTGASSTSPRPRRARPVPPASRSAEAQPFGGSERA